MKRFFKEYTTEIIALGFIIIGVFLMIEPYEIRATILTALTNAINAIFSVLLKLLSGFSDRIGILTALDVLGILLILLAAGFIAWRIRYRFHTGKRWENDFCPKCSNPIMRVHRNLWDRILGATLLPEARRYRCVNPQCGWSGLLRRHIRHQRHHSEKVSETENP